MNQPPYDRPPSELGHPGVEAVVIGVDGQKAVVLNPLNARIQWPGVVVASSEFEQLEAPAKIYEQSVAFLNAAKVLCVSAGDEAVSGKKISWSNGSVCYYCIHIATELFLKACVSLHSNQIPKTHDLRKLLSSYAEALPQREFHFQLPLAWLQVSSSFERLLDRAPDQLYRYGIGNDGKGSALTHQFSPDIVFNRIEHLERVWPRAWHALCQR